jgi:hypothetical protein
MCTNQKTFFAFIVSLALFYETSLHINFLWSYSPLSARASSLPWLHDHTHLDTPHSIGLLWTNDKLDEEVSTSKHSQVTDIHAPGEIRNRNPSKLGAADRDWINCILKLNFQVSYTP